MRKLYHTKGSIYVWGMGLLFILICSNGWSQKRVLDSLYKVLKTEKEDTNKVNTLNTLSGKLWRVGKYDTSAIYATEAEKLAQQLGFKKGVAASYRNMGIIYSDKGNYGKGLTYDSLALSVDEEISDSISIAKDYTNIGIIYDNTGDYAKGLDYYFKALRINEKFGDKNKVALNLGNIGSIYGQEGDYPKALEFFFKSLKINEGLGLKEAITHNLNNIGIIYESQGTYDKALEYYLKAVAIKQALGDKGGIARTFGGIGNVYCEKGDYAAAIDYDFKALKLDEEIGNKNGTSFILSNIGVAYDKQGDSAVAAGNPTFAISKKYADALEYDMKALDMCKEIGLKEGVANNLINIGNIYTKQKKYAAAKDYLDQALEMSKEVRNKGDVKNAYNYLSILDHLTGNDKQAFQDYKMFIIYRDSLVNEENTKKTVQSEMNFDFEQKQAAEKAEQDKKYAIAEQERKKQLVIRNSFIAGFILVLALAFFIFRGYREKQKANVVITKQKEEVEHQKSLVEEKQKEILDSIHYAQRIQKALLASDELLRKNMNEYFVLFKPKDIVSGDFYWATNKGNKFYLAVCDSTGHGVPGAFMSLLNISFLNEAINERGIVSANEVLNHTRKRLIENISQDGQQDGMDGVLIKLEGAEQLSYAAAYNVPVVVRKGELIELQADKMPVGKSPRETESFKNHEYTLQKGDVVYIFTDGYADQFGGEKGKKYKYKQLCEKLKAISSKPMEMQKQMLAADFEAWKGTLEQTDDMCIIGIRV